MLFQTLGPHKFPTRWESKQPKFLAPPQLPTFANFPLPFQPGDESTTKKDTKKTYPNPKREIAQWLSVSACLKKVLGRAGGGMFFYWKHGEAWEKKNWRSNIIKYCANSTKSDTPTSPTIELLQLPRNMPVSAYKLYSSCSYSILSYSSLSYSTLSLCTFHFQVMIFKSPEPKSPRVSQLNFLWESKNEQKRAISGKFPGICKTKAVQVDFWATGIVQKKNHLWGRCHYPAFVVDLTCFSDILFLCFS